VIRILKSALAAGACTASISLACAAEPKPHPVDGLQVGPTTTIVTEPLNEWGYPDYITVLERELSEGVAPSENFWVAFDEVLPIQSLGEAHSRQLVTRPGFENVLAAQPRFIPLAGGLTDQTEIQKIHDLHQKASERPWKADEFPAIAEWLDQNSAALDKVAAAAARPKAFAPMICSGPHKVTAGVLLPHVQESRGVARAFQARAMLHLGERRNEAAWNDILTTLRIARHLESGGFLIERLVGNALRSIMQAAACRTIADPRLSAEDIARRWTELAPLLEQVSFARVSRAERFMMLDMTLALRADAVDLDDLGIKILAPAGGDSDFAFASSHMAKIGEAVQSLLINGGDVNDVLAYCNSFHDRLDEALAEPSFLKRETAIKNLHEEFRLGDDAGSIAGSAAVAFLLAGAEGLDHVGKSLVLKQFSTGFDRQNAADARVIARNRSLHAAMAVEFLRRVTGEEISDSTALGPAVVELTAATGIGAPNAAIDPFTDEPLFVRRIEDALLIYSAGANRKDDGGKTYGDAENVDDLVSRLPRLIRN
jgi:hypothetical protein